jgi:hypothetical protein
MRYTAITLGIVLSALASSMAAAAPNDDAKKVDWVDRERDRLVSAFPTVAAVNAFIQSVLPPARDENPLPVASEFMVTDLNGDGSLQLMTNLSDGSRFFPTIIVISKTLGNFRVARAYDGGALDVPDLRDVVIDADGNGRHQLLLPRWLGGMYPGASPGPIVYDIFDYDYGQLKRANLRHAQYYRSTLLPRLASKLASLRAAPTTGHPDMDKHRLEEIAADQKAYSAMSDMLLTGWIRIYRK